MSKFGRFFFNNNDFINVFIIFIGGVTSLQNFLLCDEYIEIRGNTANPILITEIQLHYQVYHDLCKFRHI